MRVLWLLEDSQNPRYQMYLRLFQSRYGNVDILGVAESCVLEASYIRSREQSKLSLLRMLFLISKSINSKTDQYFNKRNIYSNKMISSIINVYWIFKRRYFNSLMPNYSKLVMWACSNRKTRIDYIDLSLYDSIICDSVWMRNSSFISLIIHARRLNINVDVYVSSWDNIYYTQFIDFGNHYFLWSEKMQKDCFLLHNIGSQIGFTYTGPLLFENFRKEVRLIQSNRTMLYAMAFADELMLHAEFIFIQELAKVLERIEWRLLIRPYPTLSLEDLGDLASRPNIEIYEIKADIINRFDNGSESIKFSTDEERMRFLSQGSMFLSLGTSFTIEAVISGIPTIHFTLSNDLMTTCEELYTRLSISDHIMEYFVKSLYTVGSWEDLKNVVINFKTIQQEVFTGMDRLLNSFER